MEGPTGGAGRPSVRVSTSTRTLSIQASIAAAEAEGVSYKVVPHRFSSQESIAAAEAEGVS